MTHKNLDFDPELEHKVKRVTERFSENLHIIANEPSLAFYRLQEHVHKSLPHLVEKKLEINRVHESVQGSCYDTEYAINAVNTMHASSRHLDNVQTLLKNAMFLKQQINYEALRKKGQQKSMYTKPQDEPPAQASRLKSAPKDGSGTPKHQPSPSGK